MDEKMSNIEVEVHLLRLGRKEGCFEQKPSPPAHLQAAASPARPPLYATFIANHLNFVSRRSEGKEGGRAQKFGWTDR
jgi:hypothetical protein